MELDKPDPSQILQDSRCIKQYSWVLDDISLCSSGNIAAAGRCGRQSRVCVYSSGDNIPDSRDQPTLLYHKQFTGKMSPGWRRYISFLKHNSTEIVTCRDDGVQIIDYNRDVVLRSRKVKGETRCLSVHETQIFIGLRRSDIVHVYDKDLNRIRSIRLKDFPWEIAAAAGRLIVCTSSDRVISYNQHSGSKLTEFITAPGSRRVQSVAVSIKLELTAVLYKNGTDQKQIIFFPLFANTPFLTLNVESGVTMVRISDQGMVVTINSGDVKMYHLASVLSYGHLKESLLSRLGKHDCEKLTDFFALGGEELDTVLSSDRPVASFLLALEERGIIQPSNVSRLGKAFRAVKMNQICLALNLYQKLRDQISSYDRLLAALSAHLTSSVPAKLCDYFKISDEHKNTIISRQNPGLSLLLVLDEMGVIKSSDVESLEGPLNELRLVQAVAKIHEYKEIFHEENRWKLQTESSNFEDKKRMFVEFLKRKIKSWYETMTPVPWKKSCLWKSADLFVGNRLVLTDCKSKQSVQNIDENCRLNYTEIFTHEKLKREIRIVLEGDPGSGKTMLSSQLAYDWMQGKINGVDILIFLPLKIVEDKTLIQAIEEFYIPPNTTLSRSDIESILASDTESICLLLDGLEEYSTGGRMHVEETSEVMKVIEKEKHSNCKVVITSHSEFAHDLPECPLLLLGRFGESERNSYLEKLFLHNTDKQQKIKRLIQENPFILDLCSVPLLFVLVVHNIEDMNLSEEFQLTKVSPFIRSMILTLCSSKTVKQQVDGVRSNIFRTEKMTLGELAFKGLCKGYQQLSWQKEFMESNVHSLKQWVDSGILVLEEGPVTSQAEDQDMSEIKTRKEKKENVKKKREKVDKKQRIQKAEEKGERKRRRQKDSKEDSSGKPKKKKKEREADGSEVASDEIEQFFCPSTTHNISQLTVTSEDMVTASIGSLEVVGETSKKDNQLESFVEVEADSYVKRKKTAKRTAGQVPQIVKFPHKVIQEWFAATFFCSMMKRCISEDQFKNYVSSQLQYISPTDLHYLLRFTSYLHPPSCHVIINYLLGNYRKDGSVPPYIMNCVFLCFNEHNKDKGPYMRNIVEEICKEVITIQSEESRLLQTAKSALVQYASKNGITIEKLQLKDVIFSVNQTSLILNSGVQLGILHSVKLIELSRWDQLLQEEDHKNVLKFLSVGNTLKEVRATFPSPPPELDEVTLEKIASKDIKVKWHIGHFAHSLNPKTGEWMVSFGKLGTSSLAEASLETKTAKKCKGPSTVAEDFQEPATSSLQATSTESSIYSLTQETLSQTKSDFHNGVSVPRKRSKLVFEEPAAGSVAKEVLQTGNVSSVKLKGHLKERSHENVEKKNFQDEASGVERPSLENTLVTGVEQLNQGQSSSCAIDGRFNLNQTLTGDAGESVSQKTATLESVSISGKTPSDVTQRAVCGDTSVQRTVQRFSTDIGHLFTHLEAPLSVENTITNEGGHLKIGDHGFELIIPPSAFKEEYSQYRSRMIITRHHDTVPGSSSSNLSTPVKLSTNHLTLMRPVEVKLPHLPQLEKDTWIQVDILLSPHEKSAKPGEEDVFHQSEHSADNSKYSLERTNKIANKTGGEIEIIVYIAAKPFCVPGNIAVIEVGSYLDLPGEAKMLQRNPNLDILQQKHYSLLKGGSHPLEVRLSKILPMTWFDSTPEENPHEIPFKTAAFKEFLWPFTLQHETETNNAPTCIVRVSQKENENVLQFSVRPKTFIAQPQSSIIISNQQEDPETQETPTIRQMKLQEERMSTLFELLSKDLGSAWEPFVRQLGMQDSLLHNKKQDHAGNIQNTIYYVLKAWFQKNGTKATYSILIKALRKVDRVDLADQVQAYESKELMTQGSCYLDADT